MPTSQKFASRGAGNGFPSCLSKVNVSGYDYWTTLSGVNKDSPTTSDALIAESLRLAMKVYWNIFSLVVDISATISGTGAESADLQEVDMLYTQYSNDGTEIENAYAEPRVRACGTRVCAKSVLSNPSGISRCTAYAQMTSSLLAMYNGSVDDPDLFVGYGIVSNLNFARGIASSTRARSLVGIHSYGNTSTNTTTRTYDHAYTTLTETGGTDAFHIFCKVTAQSASSGTRVANASGLSASASYVITGPTSTTYASSAEITSIGFYTY